MSHHPHHGHVAVVIGTRPEYIKLAPVVRRLRANGIPTRVLCSGQHRELLEDVRREDDLVIDVALDVFQAHQRPGQMMAKVVHAFDAAFARCPPAWVVVQGDTTTAAGAALAATQLQIPVAHVEAGLRTDTLFSPFPEESNRRLIGSLASLHFAPTSTAARALAHEGVSPDKVWITGNTVVDAVHDAGIPRVSHHDERILVTMHRRENAHGGVRSVAKALVALCARRPQLDVAWVLHPNPAVRSVVVEECAESAGIQLLQPMSHRALLQEVARSTLVLTDSGGLQEEAPALDVPVGVLRDSTERTEGIDAGVALLLGTDGESVARDVEGLLRRPQRLMSMRRAPNPYGDGRAATRIAWLLAQQLGLPFIDGIEVGHQVSFQPPSLSTPTVSLSL